MNYSITLNQNNKLYAFFLTAFLLIPNFIHAEPEEGSLTEKDDTIKWGAEINKELPNVLILGDSISIGYTLQVRKALKNKANVLRPIKKDGKVLNCQGTKNSVNKIKTWLGDTKWDVIHFNFGLHDLKHVEPKNGKNSNNPEHPQQSPPKQYKKNLTKIVKTLNDTGAKLIFANTTPIAPETTKPLRLPEYPIQYNKIAIEIMETNQIQVNDLFSLMNSNLKKYQRNKNCHFNKIGNAILAEQVSNTILSHLTKK